MEQMRITYSDSFTGEDAVSDIPYTGPWDAQNIGGTITKWFQEQAGKLESAPTKIRHVLQSSYTSRGTAGFIIECIDEEHPGQRLEYIIVGMAYKNFNPDHKPANYYDK